MPDGGGVMPSARRVAPRAMRRGGVDDTPCARTRKMSLPAKRVPSSCETLRIDAHDFTAASAGAAAMAKSAAAAKARASVLMGSAPIPGRRGAKPGASGHEHGDDLPRADVDDDRVAVDLHGAEVVLERVRPARAGEGHPEANARSAAPAVRFVEAEHERV